MLATTHAAEHDAGRRDARSGVSRLCVVTRESRPVDDLIRFVVDPDGRVVPDLKRALPGRGVWVSARRALIAAAVKRRVFGRAFKAEVAVPPDLAEQTARLMERQLLDALAMAHKSGQAVAGFARVEEALARGPVLALIHASDGQPDGLRKITATARRLCGPAAADIVVIERLTTAQLDLAFGRLNVVHAALLGGAAGKGFVGRWHRFERFLSADDVDAPTEQGGSGRGGSGRDGSGQDGSGRDGSPGAQD